MKPKHDGRPERPDLAATHHDDDGVDPRTYFDRRSQRGGGQNRALMLCSQVREAVELALSRLEREPLLLAVEFLEVCPAPNAARLLVALVAQPGTDRALVQRAIDRAQPWIRSQVAAFIHRKHCPELVFEVQLGGME